MNAPRVRNRLVEALELDTVGPGPGSPYESEALPQAPSRWYLTGFLVPYEAKAEDRQDEAGHEQLRCTPSASSSMTGSPSSPSANVTEAAQQRNIEAGVLVEDVTFARSLRGQFDALVDSGGLRRLPL